MAITCIGIPQSLPGTHSTFESLANVVESNNKEFPFFLEKDQFEI